MARRSASQTISSVGVSLGFVLATRPNRATALRTAFAAVLHAGFGFGSDRAGKVIYSYDRQGEQYAAPEVVPAGRHRTLLEALEGLTRLAAHYNQSVGLSFSSGEVAIPVTGRVYDEPGTLAVSLDFGASGWRQLVGVRRSARAATVALLDAGRTLFTLVPARYLLIGPSALLADLPPRPRAALLRGAPVAMVAPGLQATGRADPSEHTERVPRGSIVVHHWDAGAPTTPQKARCYEQVRPGLTTMRSNRR